MTWLITLLTISVLVNTYLLWERNQVSKGLERVLKNLQEMLDLQEEQ